MSPQYRFSRVFSAGFFALLTIAAVLVGSPTEVSAAAPAYDNGRIAFTRYDTTSGERSVVSVAADGSDPKLIATSASMPAFTASSNSIAYCADALMVASVDGSNPQPLGRFACSGFRLAWSPDGSKFVGIDNGGKTLAVWTLGGQRSDLATTTGQFLFPEFSADGTRIIFTEEVAGQPTKFIRLVNVDGTEMKTITTVELSKVWWASLSPKGDEVAFSHQGKLYVVGADGTNQHEIATGVSSVATPVYSPDGHWILFAGSTGDLGRRALYKIRPDGTDLTLVVETPPGFEDNFPAWQPVPRPPLQLNASVSPAPTSFGWHKSTVKVSYTCTSGMAPITCPSPITKSAEGVHTVTATASDAGGTTATNTVEVRIDVSRPSITPTIVGDAGADGWYRNATITYECSDALSGIATCPAPVSTVSGVHSIVRGAADRAGNAALTTTAVKVDHTAPTVSAAVTPAANAAGWIREPARISYSCTDTFSGVASCPSPVDVTAQGISDVIRTGSDVAGNTTSKTTRLRVDTVPPSVTVTPSRAPSANGWFRGGTRFSFTCSDATSAVQLCPSSVTPTVDGSINVEGTARDYAGNTMTALMEAKIDSVKPLIQASPNSEPNAAGWYRQDVNVSYSCSDDRSGIDSCPAPVTLNGSATLVRWAKDLAGNVSDYSTLSVKVDKAAPTLQWVPSRPLDNEWGYTGPVTFRAVCADKLSGVASCPADTSFDTDGVHTFTGTATDLAGNTTTVTKRLFIDATAPLITAKASATMGTNGWYRGAATISFACSDAVSGVRACAPTQRVTTEGVFTITGTALDYAGHTASAAATGRIDFTRPTGALDIVPGAVRSRTQPLTGAAGDGMSGVQSVTAFFSTSTSALATLSCDALRTNCTWSVPLPDRVGSLAARIVVTDAAGNVFSSTTTSFTVT